MIRNRTYKNETKVVVVEPTQENMFSAWIFDIQSDGTLIPSSPECHEKTTLKKFLNYYGAVPVKKRLVLQ